MKKQTSLSCQKAVLKSGIIYSGDNGRMFCLHCSGLSARFTGRDLSGQKVEAMGQDDAQEWFSYFGEPMACESGCTVYPAIKNAIALEVQPRHQLA